MKKTPKDVDAYIAKASKEVQGKLKELREAIKKTAPDAEERISYRMPYYGYKGRLIYFAVFKKHIGLYIPPPIIKKYKSEREDDVTREATIHLPIDGSLPITLIKKLIKAKMKDNENNEEKKNLAQKKDK